MSFSFIYTSTKGDSVLNQQIAPKLLLGQVVATPMAIKHIPKDDILSAIFCHSRGDWGTLSKENTDSNRRALQQGGRLISLYESKQGICFIVATESDNSVTIILLPQDLPETVK